MESCNCEGRGESGIAQCVFGYIGFMHNNKGKAVFWEGQIGKWHGMPCVAAVLNLNHFDESLLYFGIIIGVWTI